MMRLLNILICCSQSKKRSHDAVMKFSRFFWEQLNNAKPGTRRGRRWNKENAIAASSALEPTAGSARCGNSNWSNCWTNPGFLRPGGPWRTHWNRWKVTTFLMVKPLILEYPELRKHMETAYYDYENITVAKYEYMALLYCWPYLTILWGSILFRLRKRQGSLTPRDSPPLKRFSEDSVKIQWRLGQSVAIVWDTEVTKRPGQIHGFWPNPGQFFPDSPGATVGTIGTILSGSRWNQPVLGICVCSHRQKLFHLAALSLWSLGVTTMGWMTKGNHSNRVLTTAQRQFEPSRWFLWSLVVQHSATFNVGTYYIWIHLVLGLTQLAAG